MTHKSIELDELLSWQDGLNNKLRGYIISTMEALNISCVSLITLHTRYMSQPRFINAYSEIDHIQAFCTHHKELYVAVADSFNDSNIAIVDDYNLFVQNDKGIKKLRHIFQPIYEFTCDELNVLIQIARVMWEINYKNLCDIPLRENRCL